MNNVKEWYAKLFNLNELNQDDYIDKLLKWEFNEITANILFDLFNNTNLIIKGERSNESKLVYYLYGNIDNCNIKIKPVSKDSDIIDIEILILDKNISNSGLEFRIHESIKIDNYDYKDILIIIEKYIITLLIQKIHNLELKNSIIKLDNNENYKSEFIGNDDVNELFKNDNK